MKCQENGAIQMPACLMSLASSAILAGAILKDEPNEIMTKLNGKYNGTQSNPIQLKCKNNAIQLKLHCAHCGIWLNI